jgi:anaerobic ribonucleoside-triphosphate reductase activating protein
MESLLNIYNICEQSIALGPGKRFVMWVQGCLQNCPGCITPLSRPLNVKNLIRVNDIAERIVANNEIEGVTISGGEPFLQATNLAKLLEIVQKERPELNILVYTGYTIEQLTSLKAKTLLKYIDLLIDGPYVDKLNDERGLRGSSNQRFHYLTNKLKKDSAEIENCGRNNEIIIGTDGTHIIGIPRKDIKTSLINL